MNISLTGNPFVDTGLAVLAYKSHCNSIDELTLEKMKAVQGDGTELARRNSKLKSTSMIFTINSLATHPGIKPAEKRLQLYSAITTAFLNKIGFEDVHERCESCGNKYSLNLDKLIRETLVPLGLKNEKRYTGRDWFPLAGSIGSDAQALPAGSRTPNLCAKCLFAVHYLPQGVILRDGRLAVFQSTSKDFFYTYVSIIERDIDDRIRLDKNFQTCGSKEGSAAVVKKTLDTMYHMQFIDPGTSLFVWLFSNSGTGPECSIDEIPNDALQFLFEANKEPLQREELLQLVRKNKNPEYSFMNSIEKGADYYGLYPSKKYSGVSPELFVLYQTRIRKVSNHSLNVACKIARYLKESFSDAKKFEDFKRDFKNDFTKQNRVKKTVAELVSNGELTFRDYLALFAKSTNDSLTLNGDAWKFISYYLYHTDWLNSVDSQVTYRTVSDDLLLYVGVIIFEDQLANLGAERFKKEVIDKFTLGKITPFWLRRQFLKSAISHEGFTYEAWKALFLNAQGKEVLYEPLFRFRLMWSEWLRTNDLPKIVSPHIKPSLGYGTDLSVDIEKALISIAQDYIDKRGLTRFKKDIIDQLINGEKGLYWFRKHLSIFDATYSDDACWEQFCVKDGESIAYLRLFQLNLILINCYKEQAFKAKLAY
jgi:CRISPR-associated protein Cst1